jgi:hypothetical protein
MGAEFPVVGKSFGTGEKFSLAKAMADPPQFGQEKAATGGRAARRAFESTGGTRAAVKHVNTGVVGRGRAHFEAYDDLAERSGVSYDRVINEAYDPVTGKHTGSVEDGFVTRSGKFDTRAELGQKRGMGKHSEWTSSEQTAKEMGEMSTPERRRIARAEGSTDPKDHYRRRTQAKKADHFLRQIKEEQKLLTGKHPSTRKSPEALRKMELDTRQVIPGANRNFRAAVKSRVSRLALRADQLKGLGRKAGVLGVVASPYTTGEALVGLASKDRNEQLRSIETLNGLPEYSTGRGMTVKEKKERPVWHDETTGEWKI